MYRKFLLFFNSLKGVFRFFYSTDFIYEIDETTKKLDLQKIKEEIKENTPKWFKPEIKKFIIEKDVKR